MTMLEVYKAIRSRCDELRDDKSYPAALLDCGYLSAAADLVKSADMSEDEIAEADAFDKELLERRLLRAIDAKESSQ
jgi:hypothetical protein